MLGVNPGGDPVGQAQETIGWHMNKVLNDVPDDWSEYRDESWLGAPAGTWGMQPRVLHLLSQLGVSPGEVPASNLAFVRSRRENKIKFDMNQLAETCWIVHENIIERLQVAVILCFGKTAGKFVCKKLNAHVQIDEFIETNNRQWKSRTYTNQKGLKVVIAACPSRADWTAAATDPACLVKRALKD